MKIKIFLYRSLLIFATGLSFAACSTNDISINNLNINTTFSILLNGQEAEYVKVNTNGTTFMYDFSSWGDVVSDKFNEITISQIELEIKFETKPDEIFSIGVGYYITNMQDGSFIISEKEDTMLEWTADTLKMTTIIDIENPDLKNIIFGWNANWYNQPSQINPTVGYQYYIGMIV